MLLKYICIIVTTITIMYFKMTGFRAESPEKLPKYAALFVSPEPNNLMIIDNDSANTSTMSDIVDVDFAITPHHTSTTTTATTNSIISSQLHSRFGHTTNTNANTNNNPLLNTPQHASITTTTNTNNPNTNPNARSGNSTSSSNHIRSTSGHKLRPLRSSRHPLPSLDEQTPITHTHATTTNNTSTSTPYSGSHSNINGSGVHTGSMR